MKIEKLTENKIRIVLNIEDLEENNIDINSVLSNSPESQTLILSILNRAEKEVGFYAKDSKILIEAISFPEGIFIFTITKSPPNEYIDSCASYTYKRKPFPKRKALNFNKKKLTYSFINFEDFCEFCYALNTYIVENKNYYDIFKNASLYIYNNTYYLILSNSNNECSCLDALLPILSEFGNDVDYSNNFESKLIEHGKIIFRKNAILKTLNFFIEHKNRQD